MPRFEIALAGKYAIPVYVLFAVVLISEAALFIRNYYCHQDELRHLVAKDVNGVIINSENRRNNAQHFMLMEANGLVTEFDLTGCRLLKENNIVAGDSVSKDYNSNTIVFFKRRNGAFVKCCVYEIQLAFN